MVTRRLTANRTGSAGVRRRAALLGWLLAAGCCAGVAAQEISAERVRAALDRGAGYLRRAQRDNGSWADSSYPGGATCLASLALLAAGDSPTSAHLTDALDVITDLPNRHVYVVSLKILALAEPDAGEYRAAIHAAARWLMDAQLASGLWSYTEQKKAPFDHSNSQFALLGLHAAASAGIPVPREVWKAAETRVLATQQPDGGWSYRATGESYGSMTAANVANLLILGTPASQTLERGFREGAAPGCGRYATNRAMLNGLKWLGHRFEPDANPGRENNYVHYWLYAVERCGILSGRQHLGKHDWYREGCAALLRTQRADGSWGDGVVDTSFAVLFLAKGRKPLAVQKLRWSDDEGWNPDRHDLAHLLAFIGDRLGEPTAWQVVDFDAPLEEWLAAPLLYMQGHTFPKWSDAQCDKLRRYVEQGGTLLAEACCGRAEFRDGFLETMRATFPDHPLRELDAGHPVYAAEFPLAPAGLWGLEFGCRTAILFSPRDLSCLWEQGRVPQLSQAALQLGANIVAFAAGRSGLRERLDVITLAEDSAAAERAPAGDALRLAQVVYDGDWRPDPQVLVRLAEFLRHDAGLRVVTQYAAVRLDSPALHTHAVLYMSGHGRFELDASEQDRLAAHLRRGGFLIAEACCGRPEFDAAFRALVARLSPDAPLRRLAPDHAIFAGSQGAALDRVTYSESLRREQPDLALPELWGVEWNGRLVLVYSPYALGCGVDGHVCHGCRGLVPEDARRLMANVVLYAISN